MDLFIKNMVCDRCIMTVKLQLDAQGIPFSSVELGKAKLQEPITANQSEALNNSLKTVGFELLQDRKSSIVSQIKTAIIQYIHGEDEELATKKLSALLAEKLGLDYNTLSSLFSTLEGITVEKYVILQRIEYAKELLAYNELCLSEIADRLAYSSVQHLSQQFKKITGLTPSQFRHSSSGRKPLDKVGL